MSGMQGIAMLACGFAFLYATRYAFGEGQKRRIIYGVTGMCWALLVSLNVLSH